MTEALITESEKVVARKWECELHRTMVSLNHPCYECVRELKSPEIIETDRHTEFHNKIRETNSKPRIRI